MLIDVHNHFYPPEYLDALKRGDSEVKLTIDSEGRIFVPRIGAITVAGVRYGDVHDVISRRVARQYRGFQLEVSVARLHGVTVYVTGFAASPGSNRVAVPTCSRECPRVTRRSARSTRR